MNNKTGVHIKQQRTIITESLESLDTLDQISHPRNKPTEPINGPQCTIWKFQNRSGFFQVDPKNHALQEINPNNFELYPSY